MGFLLLLKDVFGVLVLPFTFLFGLAGWSSDMSSLDSVMGGLTPNVLRHPFRAISAAIMIAVGGLCSVLACGSPRAAVVERRMAPLYTWRCGAGWPGTGADHAASVSAATGRSAASGNGFLFP